MYAYGLLHDFAFDCVLLLYLRTTMLRHPECSLCRRSPPQALQLDPSQLEKTVYGLRLRSASIATLLIPVARSPGNGALAVCSSHGSLWGLDRDDPYTTGVVVRCSSQSQGEISFTLDHLSTVLFGQPPGAFGGRRNNKSEGCSVVPSVLYPFNYVSCVHLLRANAMRFREQ